jgi:preprotein translocase subunit SecB
MRHFLGEQPIGGISDMTNKGDFNRMLLEFANEDEVFMNRVANNEALYIQRNTP